MIPMNNAYMNKKCDLENNISMFLVVCWASQGFLIQSAFNIYTSPVLCSLSVFSEMYIILV